MEAKFNLAEDGHYVPMLNCDNLNGGIVSDVVSLENYSHASIVVQLGANTVGASVRFTVQECDDFTPTASTSIAFGYYEKKSAAGDTPSARQTATSGGVHLGATKNLYVIADLDASELSDGYPNFQVTIEDPGAATYATIFAVLSGSRYAKSTTQTAIA